VSCSGREARFGAGSVGNERDLAFEVEDAADGEGGVVVVRELGCGGEVFDVVS